MAKRARSDRSRESEPAPVRAEGEREQSLMGRVESLSDAPLSSEDRAAVVEYLKTQTRLTGYLSSMLEAREAELATLRRDGAEAKAALEELRATAEEQAAAIERLTRRVKARDFEIERRTSELLFLEKQLESFVRDRSQYQEHTRRLLHGIFQAATNDRS